MILSIIVAAAENNVIGNKNALIWHVSADLKHFKQLTTGHAVVMGRKTYESIGRPLPNRRNIVISRNPDFRPEGCEVVPGIADALRLAADEEEVFIIGGGTIYREMWNKANRLYLTLVHAAPEGDTSIPDIDPACWQEVARQDFKAGEKDDYDYSFIDYRRI
ncbi:MAG: dihydrofolate reductase [Odoribacter sp.]|nr:dihydrofolate reductase [Odoribacter sp.]